jgi:hypothetical protein
MTKGVFEIKAGLKKDFQKLLRELRMLEEFEAGRIKCVFCEKTVSFENLGGLIFIEGKPRLFCREKECYLKALLRKEKGLNESK